MSVREQRAVGRLPDELESPRAKLVYLYLASTDGASLADIQDGVGLKRITLYSILRTLSDRGLIDRDGDRYLPA